MRLALSVSGLVLAALAATAPGTVPAQGAAFLSAEEHADWLAIGRVNVAGFNSRGMCTGTLVAPDRVLTAAHCVFTDDGDAVPLDRLRFVAGWFRGEHAGAAEVVGVETQDRYQSALERGEMDIGADNAILTLAAPLPGVDPIPAAYPRRLTKVRIVGYRWDRPHALSDTGPCGHRRLDRGVMEMTCEATFGNSGGPILQQQDGTWHIVGVVSAIAADGRTFAAPLPPGLVN